VSSSRPDSPEAGLPRFIQASSKHRKESANQPVWNWRIAAKALAGINAHISYLAGYTKEFF
jgi:hypothetical protein